MELPRALAPWAPYLDLFPPEVGLALGPLVLRVALALGPLASRAGLDGSEPDGFDGLTRRGPYERLMISELAVAEEHPEEFVRRAAMGEHLFYRLALRSPVRSRMSMALFDAGPNQLGSPRVAHVAALVALTRRAEAAGARFGWSVLQRPDLPLFSEVTAENVVRLLELRSSEEATNAHVAAWRERLAEWADLDDLWLVGGARLGRLATARGLPRLDVVDPCDPASRHLELSVRAASASRDVRLELPDDRTCARLLRDPFDASSGAAVSIAKAHAPGTNLLFDTSGLKLFARRSGGGIVAYPVPNSPRAGVGRPKIYGPYSGGVLAVGRSFRKVVVVSAGGGMFSLAAPGSKGLLPPRGYYMPLGGASVAPPGPSLGSVHVVPAASADRVEALVFDPSGVLLRLTPWPDHSTVVDGLFVTGAAAVAATNVLAASTHFSRLVFLGRERPDAPVRLVSVGASKVWEDVSLDGEPAEAFFGFGGGLSRNEYGLVALRFGEHRWRILTSGGPMDHVVSEHARVVGVVARPGRTGVAGLLTVGDDGRTIALETQGWRKELVTALGPIAAVAVSTSSPTIAFSTERGEVVLWSLAYGATLCRFSAEGAP